MIIIIILIIQFIHIAPLQSASQDKIGNKQQIKDLRGGKYCQHKEIKSKK